MEITEKSTRFQNLFLWFLPSYLNYIISKLFISMIERSLLMKTNSKKFSIKDWFEKNKLYILAFVLPILSMLIVYYFKNIFPFGDQMYLRSDYSHLFHLI